MTKARPRREGEDRFVEVALPLPLFQTFTYRLGGRDPVRPGTRVLVSFSGRERIGWIVGEGNPPSGSRILPVIDLLETEPSAGPDILGLCRWMADYYVAPLGIALRAALPSVLSDSSRTLIVSTGVEVDGPLPLREEALLGLLTEASGPRSARALRRQLGGRSIWPEIRSLVARGLIAHETVPPRPPPVKTRRVVTVTRWLEDLQELEELFGRAVRQREAYAWLEAAGGESDLSAMTESGGFSRGVIRGLEEKGLASVEDREMIRDPFAALPVEAPPSLVPTPAQERALASLLTQLDAQNPRPVLLHGVTGSGKTLVYIEFLREVLARGKTAVVLVPEISLTPQTVSRFRSHFGDRVAVLHSALSEGERYDAWRQLARGDKTIAVGARSAIFAPLRNLGAVIVDEEHEGTYKQSEAPRYQGRDLAVVRAARAGAVAVLGSATPSLESWANAAEDKYELSTLPDRAAGQPPPPVRVVDLRAAPANRRVLSEELTTAVGLRLDRGEQVILLLNRRGYSSFVQCQECGDVRQCLHCSISLTFHRGTGRLLCHHCRHEEPAPTRCERCGSKDLSFRGIGTEQVERLVFETFPEARVARMDVDTTSGKWSHHEILGRVERGEVDILLGTQMIAKGLDFPNVTLVGVVNADVGIHLPDFRASERAFQLLSQVAGRTGRGVLEGEVIIQTSLPDHYAVRCAVAHDYVGFAQRELKEREDPPYAPHVRMANVVISSPDPERAASTAETASRWMSRWIRGSGSRVDLIGPAPCPIERLHGRWRWHFVLRARSAGDVGRACAAMIMDHELRGGGDVRLALDRDPVALL
jgi:primosomal protein N' (replication factor Y)